MGFGNIFKAVSSYEKAEEILLRCEADIARPELLSLVQIHHAQVHMLLLFVCWFACFFSIMKFASFVANFSNMLFQMCSACYLKVQGIIVWIKNLNLKSLRKPFQN